MKKLILIIATVSLAFMGAAAQAQTSYSTNFDNMSLGSIYGQQGWADLNTIGTDGNNYVQAVTNAASYSGVQSWLLSNAYNDTTVRCIGAPVLALAGESPTSYGQTPAYNQFNESFWFRTVATTDNPGLYITSSIGEAASIRTTWVGITEDSGNLFVSAYGTDPSGQFTINPTTPALTWGAWYQVNVTATFLPGTDNDQVNYQVLDTSGNILLNSTIPSWETYYNNNPGAEGAPGPVGSNQVSWGLNADPNSQGIYVDNFSESVDELVPEPSSWALAFVGVALFGCLRQRARPKIGR